MALLYFLSFLLLVFNLYFLFDERFGIRISIVIAWAMQMLLAYAVTEFLSLFSIIRHETIFVFYVTIIIILAAHLIINRHNINFKPRTKIVSDAFLAHLVYLIPIVLIILITGFIAIYSPPNTWDALTYHLGRVMHWIQHHNIAYYPTHINRQLFNPPLAEYNMMHLYLLDNGDRYLNMPEWISYIACIVSVSLITQELGGNFKTQLFSSLVATTIPMAILQSTNTKNDLVVTFYALASVLFFIKSMKQFSLINAIFSGFCIAGAIVTKGTAYVYLIPVLTVLCLFISKYRADKVKSIAIISVIIIMVIAPLFIRNYMAYKHPLGSSKADRQTYANEDFGIKPLASNIVKNIYIHLSNVYLFQDNHFFTLNASLWKKNVEDFHRLINYNESDPKTTWFGAPIDFTINRDEDYAGNFLHLILSLVSIIVLVIHIKKYNHENLVIYTFAIIFSFLFFSFYLKWQPWHSRFHTFYFFMLAPVTAIVLSGSAYWIKYAIGFLLVLGSTNYVIQNATRSLAFSGTNILKKNRDEIMLTKRGLSFILDCQKAERLTDSSNMKTIGLILGNDDWDYAIQYIIKRSNNEVTFYHINVDTFATPQKVLDRYNYTNLNPDLIIATKDRELDSLIYNNRIKYKYFNGNTFAIYK